jgi:signal transduction histidine kinase
MCGSEEALADFFADAPIGLLWLGPDGRILRANQTQAAMLGRGGRSLFGRRLGEFCAEPEAIEAVLGRLGRKEPVCDYPLVLVRRDRSRLQALIDASGVWEGGRLARSRWFVRDETRRRELEKEILGIGERVQRRIGQDLHDDLCQQLTGIEFLCRALERELADVARPEARRAGEIAQITRQAIHHAHDLSHGLSPMELEAEGLTVALRNLAAGARNLFGIDCRFRGRAGAGGEDPEARIHLYRIAQEALTNAIKHGKAKRIDIRLEAGPGKIILSVQDDGAGLPARQARDHGANGFGLPIMDCRARALQGSLALRSRKGGGTLLVCAIPRGPVRSPARGRK